MKGGSNFNKQHREQSQGGRCGLVSCFLVLWALTMAGGSLYFFRDSILPVNADGAPSGSASSVAVSAPQLRQASGRSAGLGGDLPVQGAGTPSAAAQAEPRSPGLSPPQEGGQGGGAVGELLKQAAPKPKPAPAALAAPAPLLKTKDMWAMTATQQRAYLQVS